MNRKCANLVILLLVLILATGLLALYFLSPPEERVADREVVGGLITGALAEYYSAHGEYPPYLLGSTDQPFHLVPAHVFTRVKGSGLFKPTIEQLYGRDPLLAGGFLRRYPLVDPQPVNPQTTTTCEGPVTRRTRWACCFYPVHAPEVCRWDLPLYGLDGTRIDSRLAGKRMLALGGVEEVQPDGGVMQELAGLPGNPDFGRTLRFRELTGFGYARGDDFGGSPQQAWLWFYVKAEDALRRPSLEERETARARSEVEGREPVEYYQEVTGLDILNAATGEVRPDGIPDGVLLVYELSGGKVENVRRWEG